MRTTVRLADDLLREAKKRAATERRSLTSLIEEGLNLVLSPARVERKKQTQLPVSKASGGVLPGVDLDRSSDLEEIMDKP
jgi:hypothetical protein